MPTNIITPAPISTAGQKAAPPTRSTGESNPSQSNVTASTSSSHPTSTNVTKKTVAKGPPTFMKIVTDHEMAVRKAEAKKHALSAPKKTETFHGTPPGHFVLTSLQPLKTKAGSKKKWVELYCKGLRKVVCCFRGHQDAAVALGLDRKKIRKMCEKSGDDFPIFPTFSLMHASNHVNAPAYHYGIHEEDFTRKASRETYGVRLNRFMRTHDQDKKRAEKVEERPPTNEIPLAVLNANPNDVDEGGRSDTSGMNDDLLVTVVENEQFLLNKEHQGLCIICQEDKAAVIFQPCRHSVLCEKCFANNKRLKFCHVCRTTLVSSSLPEKIKYVRPRIFSAYTFREI